LTAERRLRYVGGTFYSTTYGPTEASMLVITAPGAAVVTTTEVKRDIPGAFKVAEERRVYVTKDGQPIGGLVSMAMMELLEEALADRQIGAVAARRLEAIRAGDDDLIDADEFFTQADAVLAARPRR